MTTTEGHWPVSAEEYHATNDAVSHSMLDIFHVSPARYHGRFVTGELPVPQPTEAMQLGTLFHLCVLQPERWQKEIVVSEKFDKRTTVGKAGYAAFLERTQGKQAVDEETFNLVEDMAEAILDNEFARSLIAMNRSSGKAEWAIRWTCPETGLQCKALLDWLVSQATVDLKTAIASTPASFSKACVNFGYHRQAAHYSLGVETVYGARRPFVFVVVDKTPPHPVGVYELDDAAMRLGAAENLAALRSLAKTIESGDWRDPQERQVTKLSLPRYAEYASEFSIQE